MTCDVRLIWGAWLFCASCSEAPTARRDELFAYDEPGGDAQATGDAGDEDDPESEAAPLRVLFIGNSYTSYNDLPSVVRALAAEAGEPMEVEAVLKDGASLWDHWTSTGAAAAIESGAFDVVVFQGQSLEPIYEPLGFDAAAEGLAGLMNAAESRGVAFATWPRRADHEFYEGPWGVRTPEELNRRVQLAYDGATHWIDDGYAALVGAVWLLAQEELPDVTLYLDDGSHPTREGTLLAACALYFGITGHTPALPDPPPLEVAPETARALCALATRIPCGDPSRTLCDGSCVALLSDPDHCGACANMCSVHLPVSW